MRSPLHARTAAIAVTLFLSLVLVVNITIGQHAGPLGATPADAGYILGDSSSDDSLLSEAFSSILAPSSSSLDFGSASFSPYLPPTSAYAASSDISFESMSMPFSIPSTSSSSDDSGFDPSSYYPSSWIGH